MQVCLDRCALGDRAAEREQVLRREVDAPHFHAKLHWYGALRAWAAERTTLHPRTAMEAPMVLKSFWQQRWNADVIWCRRSTNPPHAHQRRAATELGARWHEIDTGHYPMLSTPDELVRIILSQ